MTGTYRGRSRHRLPRREGARIAGRTGGVPQYVPVDVSPPATVFPQKRSKWHLPASHLTRNPCKSVPSGISLLSTCYEIPTKACQVAFPCCPPDTESPQKCGRWHLSAVHLLRNLRKSVPGGIFLPSTWHGIPAKMFQVSFPAAHLTRNPRESVPGGISLLFT